MHKISAPGNVEGRFVSEDVNLGRPPTQISADWMNAVQDELVAVVEAAGLTLASDNNAQLLAAIVSLISAAVEGGALDYTNPDFLAAIRANALPRGYFLACDERAQGTHGGASLANTISQRVLNTVKASTIVGASLTSNVVTLPAGTYRIYGQCPGMWVNKHKCGLFSLTENAYKLFGTPSQTSSATVGADRVTTISEFRGRLVLATNTDFEIRHWTELAHSQGFGQAVDVIGPETYAFLEAWQES